MTEVPTHPIGFMSACRIFFGLKPGQTPIEFGRELQALSPQDRDYITTGLEQNGFIVERKAAA